MVPSKSDFCVRALRVEVAKHTDAKVAQQWMNAVPIDGLIDCVVDGWSIGGPLVQEIANVYVASWTASLEAKYGMGENIAVEVLIDPDSGDEIVRLNQS